MAISVRLVPFNIFQEHCCERRFKYMGRAGHFFVTCSIGGDMCNNRVCSVWNSNLIADYNKDMKNNENYTFHDDQQVMDAELPSLRNINTRLKNNTDLQKEAEQIAES